MPDIDQYARERMRVLAREARLIDECFTQFQLATYPTAKPIVSEALRRSFFAGAAALSALLQANLAEDDDFTEAETDLLVKWIDEVTAFHEHTIGALDRQVNHNDHGGGTECQET